MIVYGEDGVVRVVVVVVEVVLVEVVVVVVVASGKMSGERTREEIEGI